VGDLNTRAHGEELQRALDEFVNLPRCGVSTDLELADEPPGLGWQTEQHTLRQGPGNLVAFPITDDLEPFCPALAAKVPQHANAISQRGELPPSWDDPPPPDPPSANKTARKDKI
jgi:hypothetical protein